MECGTGSGVFSERLSINESYKLPDECTVFQAEIFGVYKAAEISLEYKVHDKDIRICVDIQAALKALNSVKVNSYLVKICIGKLNNLSQGNRVILCWVPGHEGNEGNEAADGLARKGSENGVRVDPKLPIGHFRNLITSRTEHLTAHR